MISFNKEIWESVRNRVPRLPHAVLIQGPEGVGKLALAEGLAARLLCESPTQDSEACGRCAGCRWVAAGSHPDLRRIEPDALSQAGASGEETEADAGGRASRRAKPSMEIRVDQVRELADFLYLGSHRGRRRVAIVHPAETMNVHAANALLKGLEEPPAGAFFLLVSHHPARLLPTIRSRCVSLSVPRPDAAEALKWLKTVVPAAEAARWLKFAGGAPRIAAQYARGERGAALVPYLSALTQGEPGDLPEASDREGLEAMAEALQKHAIDRLTVALAGRTIYGTEGAQRSTGQQEGALRWASFAREMGRARALSRHPVNARLFAAEMKYKLIDIHDNQ